MPAMSTAELRDLPHEPALDVLYIAVSGAMLPMSVMEYRREGARTMKLSRRLFQKS